MKEAEKSLASITEVDNAVGLGEEVKKKQEKSLFSLSFCWLLAKDFSRFGFFSAVSDSSISDLRVFYLLYWFLNSFPEWLD